MPDVGQIRSVRPHGASRRHCLCRLPLVYTSFKAADRTELCFHVKWPPEPGALPAKRHSGDNPASPGLQRPGPGKTSLSTQRGPGLAGQNHRAGCGSRLPFWGGVPVFTCSRVDGRRWLQFRCRLWPRGGALAPPLPWDPTVLPLPVGAASPGPWPERPTSCSPRTSSSAVATSDRRGPPQARVSFQDRG